MAVGAVHVDDREPGGFFLWHSPRGHPHWTLSSILPYGVRTFLKGETASAITRPTHARSLSCNGMPVKDPFESPVCGRGSAGR